MKGLSRQNCTQQVKRAMPITKEMLDVLASRISDDDNLVTWRTLWRMCIAFTCFLRFDDIKRLKVLLKILYLLLLKNSYDLISHSGIRPHSRKQRPRSLLPIASCRWENQPT